MADDLTATQRAQKIAMERFTQNTREITGVLGELVAIAERSRSPIDDGRGRSPIDDSMTRTRDNRSVKTLKIWENIKKMFSKTVRIAEDKEKRDKKAEGESSFSKIRKIGGQVATTYNKGKGKGMTLLQQFVQEKPKEKEKSMLRKVLGKLISVAVKGAFILSIIAGIGSLSKNKQFVESIKNLGKNIGTAISGWWDQSAEMRAGLSKTFNETYLPMIKGFFSRENIEAGLLTIYKGLSFVMEKVFDFLWDHADDIAGGIMLAVEKAFAIAWKVVGEIIKQSVGKIGDSFEDKGFLGGVVEAFRQAGIAAATIFAARFLPIIGGPIKLMTKFGWFLTKNIVPLIGTMFSTLGKIGGFLKNTLFPALGKVFGKLKTFGGFLASKISPMMAGLGRMATSFGAMLLRLAITLGPITGIIIGIGVIINRGLKIKEILTDIHETNREAAILEAENNAADIAYIEKIDKSLEASKKRIEELRKGPQSSQSDDEVRRLESDSRIQEILRKQVKNLENEDGNNMGLIKIQNAVLQKELVKIRREQRNEMIFALKASDDLDKATKDRINELKKMSLDEQIAEESKVNGSKKFMEELKKLRKASDDAKISEESRQKVTSVPKNVDMQLSPTSKALEDMKISLAALEKNSDRDYKMQIEGIQSEINAIEQATIANAAAASGTTAAVKENTEITRPPEDETRDFGTELLSELSRRAWADISGNQEAFL